LWAYQKEPQAFQIRRVEKLTASDLQTASYLRGKDWRPFVLRVESRFSLGAFGITRDQSSK
jgi:hypothetical protein